MHIFAFDFFLIDGEMDGLCRSPSSLQAQTAAVFAILCLLQFAFCNLKLQRKLPHKFAKHSAMFRGKCLNGNTCDDGRDTRDAAD